jgi:hypothetical protein
VEGLNKIHSSHLGWDANECLVYVECHTSCIKAEALNKQQFVSCSKAKLSDPIHYILFPILTAIVLSQYHFITYTIHDWWFVNWFCSWYTAWLMVC